MLDRSQGVKERAKAVRDERPELLETGFDAWLADEFVPRALDAVKRRKKGQAAKKM